MGRLFAYVLISVSLAFFPAPATALVQSILPGGAWLVIAGSIAILVLALVGVVVEVVDEGAE